MTAHLESTKDCYKERKIQLKKFFTHTQEQSPNTLVFFGEVLNIRDKEINSIGHLPQNIHDVWQATGEREECKYT